MDQWAFATSAAPYGLGLSDVEFWYLSHEEYDAKCDVFQRYYDRQRDLFAAIRADLHNGAVTRNDKQMWVPQDFGAPGKPQRTLRRKWKPEELLPRLRTAMAGKLKDENGKPISAVASLKGQPLPPRKRA